jgi:protein O-mannosyl-transferase
MTAIKILQTHGGPEMSNSFSLPNNPAPTSQSPAPTQESSPSSPTPRIVHHPATNCYNLHDNPHKLTSFNRRWHPTATEPQGTSHCNHRQLPDYISVSESALSAKKDASRREVWLLVLLVLLVFGRICAHGFTNWDDNLTLSQNPDFNPPTVHSVLHYWYTPHLSLYIPATYTIWGFLTYLSSFGSSDYATPNPWIFHTASVLIHLASALIVFAILLRLVKNQWAAFLGAAIFALHPVQVEAVAWASGAKDLLCGMFSLLAIWQYIRFVQQDRKSRIVYLFATLALVAALLSKPTAIITPFLALVVDHWLLGRSWRENFKSLWPWFVLIVPIAVIARLVQNIEGVPFTPLWARPLIYTDAMAFYLCKLFWPMHLALDYARTPTYAMSQGWIYWTWIFPAIAALAILIFRRHRWLVAGALLFLIAWLPISGLSTFLFQYYSTVADHYLYLPMFGIAVIVAFFIAEHPSLRWPTGLIVLLLAILSFIQAGYWRNDETLYRHALAISPRSFVSHTNLSTVLISQGHLDAAEQHLLDATQIDPNYYQAWESLAELRAQRGEIDPALDAEQHAMTARLLLPPRTLITYPAQLDFYGQLLMKKGRTAQAIDQFNHALNLNPNYVPAKKHLDEARRADGTTQ